MSADDIYTNLYSIQTTNFLTTFDVDETRHLRNLFLPAEQIASCEILRSHTNISRYMNIADKKSLICLSLSRQVVYVFAFIDIFLKNPDPRVPRLKCDTQGLRIRPG